MVGKGVIMFKVGDKVRVIDTSHFQPLEMNGKIFTISEVYGDFIYIFNNPDDAVPYLFFPSDLRKVSPRTYKPMTGKFTMPDGTPGEVHVLVFGNVTQVTIIVNPQTQYDFDTDDQFYTGMAFCNPCDTFDLNTGIKVACKHALTWMIRIRPKERVIYSSIRKAMRGKNV
jgi:hypothetical protein